MSLTVSPFTPDPTIHYPSFNDPDVGPPVISLPVVQQKREITWRMALIVSSAFSVVSLISDAGVVVNMCIGEETKNCWRRGGIALGVIAGFLLFATMVISLLAYYRNRKTEASLPL